MVSPELGECLIQYEPDISGIGIRISLYIQTVTAPFLIALTKSDELATALQSSLGLSGIGLLLTTLIHTFTNAITLYDGIIAFHLISLVGLTIKSKYGIKGASQLMRLSFTTLYWFTILTFIAWAIYLWSQAPDFGVQPECNYRTIYVIMFVNIKAAGPVFRKLLTALLALLLAVFFVSYFVTVSCTIPQFLRMRREQRNSARDEIDLEAPPAPKASRTLVSTLFGTKSSSTAATTTTTTSEPPPAPLRRQSTINALTRDKNKLVAHFLGVAYQIAMIELMIHRNPTEQEDSIWGFGQVMALCLLIGPVLELMAFLVDRWNARRKDKRGAGSA